MQVWCEHIRTHWSAKERLHLIASVPREDTINIPDLITLCLHHSRYSDAYLENPCKEKYSYASSSAAPTA